MWVQCNADCPNKYRPTHTLYSKNKLHTTDGSTVLVNSREGCVTKCRAKFLNSSDRLPFERSPTKPVLTFAYTYYSLWRHILN